MFLNLLIVIVCLSFFSLFFSHLILELCLSCFSFRESTASTLVNTMLVDRWSSSASMLIMLLH